MRNMCHSRIPDIVNWMIVMPLQPYCGYRSSSENPIDRLIGQTSEILLSIAGRLPSLINHFE